MAIVLTRVDFRLIHGQVMTRWLTLKDANHILTIDEPLSKDDFMQDVFKMAAPQGIKVTIVSPEKAVEMQKEGEFEKSRILILFKNVQQLEEAVNLGLEIPEVQIGGLGGGPGRKAVNNAITFDQTDANILLSLQAKGMHIYLQTTPDYPSETLDNAVAKLS